MISFPLTCNLRTKLFWGTLYIFLLSLSISISLYLSHQPSHLIMSTYLDFISFYISPATLPASPTSSQATNECDWRNFSTQFRISARPIPSFHFPQLHPFCLSFGMVDLAKSHSLPHNLADRGLEDFQSKFVSRTSAVGPDYLLAIAMGRLFPVNNDNFVANLQPIVEVKRSKEQSYIERVALIHSGIP